MKKSSRIDLDLPRDFLEIVSICSNQALVFPITDWGGKSKAAEKSKAATDTETFTELEVGESALAESHPPFAGIVGCDVCVLPAAFPNDAAPKIGMIGWRGEVTAKRGARSKGNEQIEVFGAWTTQDRLRRVT